MLKLNKPARQWLKAGFIIFPAVFLSLFAFSSQRGMKGNYGQDAPFVLLTFISLSFLFLLVFIPLTLSSGLSKLVKGGVGLLVLLVGMWGFLISISLAFGSWDGKFDVVADLTEDLDEEGFFSGSSSLSILDIGCGAGLFSLTLAKKMDRRGTEGTVWCIDVWSETDQFANKNENIFKNAKLEGVDESRIVALTGDAREMPPGWTNKFDLVVQSLALHNIEEGNFTEIAKKERARAIKEIVRVTKPDGKILMWDICPADPTFTGGGCAVKEFYEEMKALEDKKVLGEVQIRGPMLVFSPSYIVQGKKIVEHTFKI